MYLAESSIDAPAPAGSGPHGEQLRSATRREQFLKPRIPSKRRKLRAAFGAAAARIDLERLMAVAEPKVRQGMALMMDEGISVAAAARVIGIPRKTLRRRLHSTLQLLHGG
jgi:DNA-directed RNA polymerase specialized sigma24 family protein